MTPKSLFMISSESDPAFVMPSSVLRNLRDVRGRRLFLVELDPPQKFFDYRTRKARECRVVGVGPRHAGVSFENGVQPGEMADLIEFEAPTEDEIEDVVAKDVKYRRLDIVRVFETLDGIRDYISNPWKYWPPGTIRQGSNDLQ